MIVPARNHLTLSPWRRGSLAGLGRRGRFLTGCPISVAETSCQVKKKLASYIRLKLAAQQRPRHPIELVMPDGSVIDRLIERSKMREFVYERLEAVVFGVATHQNSLVASQEDAANRSPVDPLNLQSCGPGIRANL